MADAHKNFAYSTVAGGTAVGSSSGTTLTVATGDGAKFPAAPFNLTVWPASTMPLASNAEIMRVTGISTDTFTVTRNAETGGAALTGIANGYQVAATITAKTLQDVEGLAPSGDTSGATDTTAIQALLNLGGRTVLQAGTFYISSTLNMTVNGGSLIGASSGATTIQGVAGMAGNVLIQVGNGSVTIGDTSISSLMLDSAVQKTANAAIDINKGFRTRLQNLRTYHQYVSIHVHNSTETWIDNCDLRDQSSDGIAYDSDFNSGYDLYLTNVVADNPVVSNSGNGINWTGGENLVIHNCDFIHFAVGLMINPGASRQCRWGFLTGAEFDTASDNCIKFSNASGDVVGITLTNCWAGTATNYGVLIDGSGSGAMNGISIIGSKILHNGLAGIRYVAGATNVTISGCQIISNSQTSSNTRSGIEVTASASDFVITGNQIGNGWAQGSTQSNGINFDSGGTNHFVISDNDCRNNLNQGINGLSAVTGTDAYVRNNLGMSPGPGAWGSQPSVPSSTVAQINTSFRDAAVSIKGGTVTVVAVDGVTCATATGTTVIVPYGKTITLTYSVAPTWAWTLL